MQILKLHTLYADLSNADNISQPTQSQKKIHKCGNYKNVSPLIQNSPPNRLTKMSMYCISKNKILPKKLIRMGCFRQQEDL
jgi:hypothetical protein